MVRSAVASKIVSWQTAQIPCFWKNNRDSVLRTRESQRSKGECVAALFKPNREFFRSRFAKTEGKDRLWFENSMPATGPAKVEPLSLELYLISGHNHRIDCLGRLKARCAPFMGKRRKNIAKLGTEVIRFGWLKYHKRYNVYQLLIVLGAAVLLRA